MGAVYERSRHLAILWVALLVLVGGPSSASAGCNTTDPIVGFVGALAGTLDHGTSGTIVVIDDCRFAVQNFSYDGMAPDTHFYGAKVNSTVYDVPLTAKLERAYTNEFLVYTLPAGTTFSSLGSISVWCVIAAANFASVNLVSQPAGAALAPTVVAARKQADGSTGCGTTDKKVGYVGALGGTLDHGVGGTTVIIDDCRFVVENFTYDGKAPDLHFYGAATGSTNYSIELTSQLEKRAYTGELLVYTLPAGRSFSSLSSISVWCVIAQANFANVELVNQPPGAASAPAVVAARSLADGVAAPAQPPASPLAAACAQTDSRVGFDGTLSMKYHMLAGRVLIIDNCRFVVRGFTYDGEAPQAYWFVTTPGQADGDGMAVSPRLARAYTNEDVVVTLPGSLSFSSLAKIFVWCELARANFGEVALTNAAAGAASAPAIMSARQFADAGTAAAPPPAVPTELMMFDNCLVLLKDKYNLYWSYNKATGLVTYGVLTSLGTDRYLAFGLQKQDAPSPTMVGGDVVIAGIVNGVPYAQDYYLSEKAQCNFDAGGTSGVCPDSLLGKSNTTENAKLLSYVTIGGNMLVTYTKNITTSDSMYDVSVPPSSAVRLAIWAIGPFTNQSNQVVPLWHHETKGGVSFNILQAPTGPGFCPLPTAAASGPSALVPPADFVALPNTDIRVTIGPNPNYPDPPGWGISYRFNDVETPTLLLARGSTYRFIITAGADHPLYFTSDKTGGNPSAPTFAGGLAYNGTALNPAILIVTPNASWPDNLYYQCAEHRKLGWKVVVQESAALMGNAAYAVRGSATSAMLLSILVVVIGIFL